jgi:hypothetical protein
MAGGAKFGHLLAAFCFGSFFAGEERHEVSMVTCLLNSLTYNLEFICDLAYLDYFPGENMTSVIEK